MRNGGEHSSRDVSWEALKTLVSRLSRLGKWAVFYARMMGWAVFPLLPGTKIPMPGSHGFRDATNDVVQVIEWWTVTPDANIGIATGTISGLFVIDIDLYKEAVHEALDEIETKYGRFPPTLTATSARGGQHLYFGVQRS